MHIYTIKSGAGIGVTLLLDLIISNYDIITCIHFPHYWSLVKRINRLPLDSQHKGGGGGGGGGSVCVCVCGGGGGACDVDKMIRYIIYQGPPTDDRLCFSCILSLELHFILAILLS